MFALEVQIVVLFMITTIWTIVKPLLTVWNETKRVLILFIYRYFIKV